MCQGFIKDYRQELKSDIWIMPPLYHRVWQYLKYQVNHTENEIPMRDGTKFLIKKGQHLTSYRSIAKDIGWYEGLVWKEPNSKTIKTICDWLEKNNMIVIEHGRGNRQYTLISIVNWERYQSKDKDGVTAEKQQSNSAETDGKQFADINKNDKECNENEKNEEKVYTPKKTTKKKSKEEVPKKQYADYVSMTEIEYSKLIEKHGEILARKMINTLSIYKGANGKTYKNDYLAILNWVEDKVLKEMNRSNTGRMEGKNASNKRDIEQELREQGIGL